MPLIGVVGPCASGKTTLVSMLKKLGYEVRHIAQEHSYVSYMWQRITNPDVLIYLHASYPTTLVRRQMNWNQSEYERQIERLLHARQHASLYIDTDSLTSEEVLQRVLEFLHFIEINP